MEKKDKRSTRLVIYRQLRRTSGSVVVAIPPEFLKALSLKEGDWVRFSTYSPTSVIITKAESR